MIFIRNEQWSLIFKLLFSGQIIFMDSLAIRKTKITIGKQRKVCTNLYPITLKKQFNEMHQYSITIDPPIAQGSNTLLKKIINQMNRDLKSKLGKYHFRGYMLWAQKQHPIAISFKIKIQKQSQFQYEITIKYATKLPVLSFLQSNQSTLCTQSLNSKQKSILQSKMHMIQLDKGKFYKSKSFMTKKIKEANLSIWTGIQANVVCSQSQLYLQVDLCSRILGTSTLLQLLQYDINQLKTENKSKKLISEQLTNKYQGLTIIAHYGNHKTYKITSIDYSINTTDEFYHTGRAGKISYSNYFRQQYGLPAAKPNQPVLKARKKLKITQGQQQNEEVILLPQFVGITGLSEEQAKNHRLRKQIDLFVKPNINGRITEVENFVNELSTYKELPFYLGDRLKINSYQMKDIDVIMQRTVNSKQGKFNVKQKVKNPIVFDNYIFAYSTLSNLKQARNNADFALDTLMDCSKTFGIKMDQPKFVQFKNIQLKTWIQALRQQIDEQIKKKKPPKIIFVMFQTAKEESYYGKIKSFLLYEYNVPSQMFRTKILGKRNKNPMACASGILLQANVKVGGDLWEVPKQHPYWKGKNIATCSMATSKGTKGRILAFSGTINSELTKNYSDAAKIDKFYPNTASIQILSKFFLNFFRIYLKNNKNQLPETIIVYRQGLNEHQAQLSLEQQINGFRVAIEKVEQKIGKPCKPNLVFIIVNQRSSLKFYYEDKKNGKYQYSNCEAGSIVYDDISLRGKNCFHLQTIGNKNGSSPVQFILQQEIGNRVPKQAIATLSYEQCFNYFNWSGGIRVPAIMKKAQKLANFYSGSVQIAGQSKDAFRVLEYFI